MAEGTSSPLVSVIIPTYNRARLVGEAIESVLAQTYKHLEIIVVDDGSTDGTEEALGPYRERIEYIYQQNRGASAARNTGIFRARGDYIAFLDSDDLWVPEKLELQVDYLEKHADCGLVYTDCEFLVVRDGRVVERIEKNLTGYSGYAYLQIFMRNEVFIPTVLLRRDCLGAVGYFDEKLTFFEDVDLWFRLSRCFKFGHIGKKLAVCRRYGDNITLSSPSALLEYARLLQSHAESCPEIKRALGRGRVGRRISDLFFLHARGFFEKGDFRNARKYLWEAIANYPGRWNYYFYFLLCLFPPPVVEGLRRLKRTLRAQ